MPVITIVASIIIRIEKNTDFSKRQTQGLHLTIHRTNELSDP